jgi:hypothetical protein
MLTNRKMAPDESFGVGRSAVLATSCTTVPQVIPALTKYDDNGLLKEHRADKLTPTPRPTPRCR